MRERFGDSAQNGDGNARALALISELIHEMQGESIVTSFVLMVETADGEDRWLSSFTAPGQKSWTSMGLLEYGRTFEKEFNVGLADEGDDDD